MSFPAIVPVVSAGTACSSGSPAPSSAALPKGQSVPGSAPDLSEESGEVLELPGLPHEAVLEAVNVDRVHRDM